MTVAAGPGPRRGCTVTGCARAHYARGWCARHYKQWQRGAEPGAGETAERPPCAVTGCDREAVTRGLCHGHYLRLSRTGDVAADRPLRRASPGRCTVVGCGRVTKARGLCRAHYARRLATGDVRPEQPVREVTRAGWLSHGCWYVSVPEAERHPAGGETELAEHRLVMARLLGRPLRRDESVHHRNGDRLDNSVDNLELWSSSQPSGQRVVDKVTWAEALLRRYAPALLRHNTESDDQSL